MICSDHVHPSTHRVRYIFPTLEIVYLFILTWFWKNNFQVGKNEKIKQAKIKVPKFKLTGSYLVQCMTETKLSSENLLNSFHLLFCLGQTFPMNIFLLPILASDIKTIKIMLTVCFTNDVTHHRRALAEISSAHHWRLKSVPFKNYTSVWRNLKNIHRTADMSKFSGWKKCI